MTRYFCDCCDDQLLGNEPRGSINIKGPMMPEIDDKEFSMVCRRCLNSIQSYIRGRAVRCVVETAPASSREEAGTEGHAVATSASDSAKD